MDGPDLMMVMQSVAKPATGRIRATGSRATLPNGAVTFTLTGDTQATMLIIRGSKSIPGWQQVSRKLVAGPGANEMSVSFTYARMQKVTT